MIAFVLANLKWIVPLLLFAGLAADDARLRISVANLKAQQAHDVAAAEAAVRKALQQDQELSNKLVADYAGEIATLQGRLDDALGQQRRAAATPVCDHSPAADAFDRSLRTLSDQAGAAPANTAGRAGAAVPAQPAPAGRLPE